MQHFLNNTKIFLAKLLLAFNCILLLSSYLTFTVFTDIYAFSYNFANNFYVNQATGSDTNSGQNIISPFKTLEKARDTIRSISNSMTGDIAVNIVGEYNLNSSFLLTNLDSGKNGFKIVYKSDNNIAGTLNGAIESFPSWQSIGANIYKTNITNLPQIPRTAYLNDEVQTRSTSENDNFAFSTDDSSDIVIQNNGANIGSFAYLNDIEFQGSSTNFWKHPIQKVDTVNNNLIYLKNPSNLSQSDIKFKGSNTIFATNAFELITNNKEWYYNKSTSEFFIKDSVNPTGKKLSLPMQEILINFDGVNNVDFAGLKVKYAGYNLLPNTIGIQTMAQGGYINGNLSGGYGQETMKGAIQIDNSTNLSFYNNNFNKLDSYAINCNLNCENHVIQNNQFTELGAGAIIYGNENGNYDNSGIAKYIKVYNNLINNTGLLYWGSSAVNFIYGQYIDILHNDISNTSYTAISIGWGWEYSIKASYNNTIAYNDISSFMNKLFDGAAIYTLSSQLGTVIDQNYIHNTINDYGAIYTDEGSGDLEITNNVIDSADKFWAYIWDYNVMVNISLLNNWIISSGCDTNFGSYTDGPGAGVLCEIVRGLNTVYSNNVKVSVNNLPLDAQNVINNAGRANVLVLDLSIKANLSGAYNLATNKNSTFLRNSNLIPLKGRSSLPANTVDWVTVELWQGTAQKGIKEELIDENGNINISFENITSGLYKVILRHRNHLSIATNSDVVLTNGITNNIDFTTNQNIKGNNQSLLKPNVYGLRLGNANSDNSIDSFDRNQLQITQENSGTYSNSDLNLDGIIDAGDRNLLRQQAEGVEVL